MEAAGWDRLHLWRYRAVWLPAEYMDGDTFTALPDQGYDGRRQVRVRLDDLWMPELSAPGGVDAMIALQDVLSRGQGKWPLRIVSKQRETVISEVRSFERFVSDVFYVDAAGELRDVGAELVARGHAARVLA